MTLSYIFGDKDTPKVQAKFAIPLGIAENEVTLEKVLTLQESDVRNLLGARLWTILKFVAKREGLTFAAKPKKPGLSPAVKLVADTWGRVYREETRETYGWDLARRIKGPDWMSKDWMALHEIEPALVGWVRGISPDSDYEDGALQGWADNESEGPWVIGLAERTMRGFIREFRERGWGGGVHLTKFSEHLSKYLEAAEQDQNDHAPAAFRPRVVRQAETDSALEAFAARLASRR